MINEGSFGYDPVGLEFRDFGHAGWLWPGYGWTEFEIETQQLRVKTYGIDPYTEAELLANPEHH